MEAGAMADNGKGFFVLRVVSPLSSASIEPSGHTARVRTGRLVPVALPAPDVN